MRIAAGAFPLASSSGELEAGHPRAPVAGQVDWTVPCRPYQALVPQAFESDSKPLWRSFGVTLNRAGGCEMAKPYSVYP